ncbi:hypothetical protein B0T25DRAFT_627854 [Lasiosphaeria hispida]|uniref:Uncharacterized protein n=1 Tax=Lasiosphaeria hispida TaxID=260671 RepID=A0AAJ0MKI8_9PEZI|nr:hypothetical protein B0T25DRAFT_627854 [Lasiosphaeria hispida]
MRIWQEIHDDLHLSISAGRPRQESHPLDCCRFPKTHWRTGFQHGAPCKALNALADQLKNPASKVPAASSLDRLRAGNASTTAKGDQGSSMNSLTRIVMDIATHFGSVMSSLSKERIAFADGIEGVTLAHESPPAPNLDGPPPGHTPTSGDHKDVVQPASDEGDETPAEAPADDGIEHKPPLDRMSDVEAKDITGTDAIGLSATPPGTISSSPPRPWRPSIQYTLSGVVKREAPAFAEPLQPSYEFDTCSRGVVNGEVPAPAEPARLPHGSAFSAAAQPPSVPAQSRAPPVPTQSRDPPVTSHFRLSPVSY